MKRLLILILAALLLCSCSFDDSYADLGTPTLERSGEDGISRCPWDMIFYGGALYLGGGDYDRNMGPVDIWRYDETEGKWSLDATLPEEEISNFILIGTSLAAPGIDPTEDGRLGTYYVRGETGWQTHKEIPEAFHTFDLAEYDGALFASCGVTPGTFPVLRESDGKWVGVPFAKDGVPIDTASYGSVRSYELFTVGGKLYATLFLMGEETSYEVYRYVDGGFVYHGAFIEKLNGMSFAYSMIADDAETVTGVYLATGELYYSTDLSDFKKIDFAEGDVICDVYEYGGRVFALASRENKKGGCRITLYAAEAGSTGFSELVGFNYDIPAVSLAVSDDFYYFGMGMLYHEDEGNLRGTVLAVKK